MLLVIMTNYIRYFLTFILISAGLSHFIFPSEFATAIPPKMGNPFVWIYLTGFLELVFAITLLIPKLRLLTSYLLIFYFFALLPAHFQVLINDTGIFGFTDKWFLTTRLFIQPIPIFMAWLSRKSNHRSIFNALQRFDDALSTRFKEQDAWKAKWLSAAAFYNIAWGAWVVIFPEQAFELFDMNIPMYPFIWQSVGMIVGVYGIVYAYAAIDPNKYFPIVLVGTLGKIFGPIGFIFHYSQDNIPLEFGTLLIFNDLIWWPSFFLICYQYFFGQKR